MTIRDAALRVAALSALRDTIDDACEHARGELLTAMLADPDQGMKWPVVLPGGDTVGHVSLVKPRPPASSTLRVDEGKFLAWVEANRPDELITTIRDSTRRAVLAQLYVAGDYVIGPGGEVVDFATITPAPPPGSPSRPRSFQLRFTPDGRTAIATAWRAGDLDALDPTMAPEIEGGAE